MVTSYAGRRPVTSARPPPPQLRIREGPLRCGPTLASMARAAAASTTANFCEQRALGRPAAIEIAGLTPGPGRGLAAAPGPWFPEPRRASEPWRQLLRPGVGARVRLLQHQAGAEVVQSAVLLALHADLGGGGGAACRRN